MQNFLCGAELRLRNPWPHDKAERPRGVPVHRPAFILLSDSSTLARAGCQQIFHIFKSFYRHAILRHATDAVAAIYVFLIRKQKTRGALIDTKIVFLL